MDARLRLVGIVLAGFAMGGLAAVALIPSVGEQVLPSATLRSAGRALVGGPFTLTDDTGKRVTERDYAGKFMLVFFGFTNCPDVCPTELQVMAAALNKLGAKADRIVPIFITVDPERDTPQAMASYVKSFHPRLVGLTGSQAEIDTVVKEYRVYAKKVADPKSTAGYTMDHSAILYVMGPDGAYRTHFTHTTDVDNLAERLGKML